MVDFFLLTTVQEIKILYLGHQKLQLQDGKIIRKLSDQFSSNTLISFKN